MNGYYDRKLNLSMVMMIICSPSGGVACIAGNIIFFVWATITKFAVDEEAGVPPRVRFGHLVILMLASTFMVLYGASGVRTATEAKELLRQLQAHVLLSCLLSLL